MASSAERHIPVGGFEQPDSGQAGQTPRFPGQVTVSTEAAPTGLPEGVLFVRSTDAKGRITLGSPFANITFTVKQGSDATEIILTASSVIPMREIWLYQNPEALASVMRGLEQARAGQVSESPPDLDADQPLADED